MVEAEDSSTRDRLKAAELLSRSGELVEPKTAAAKRDVPMPPSLARMLAAHRLASPYSAGTDYVFASTTGTPLTVRNIVRRGLAIAIAKAGLPHLRWHDLRHVAASALIAEGASVGYVSRLLGHSSPAITLSVYSNEFSRAEHDAATRERMEAAFGDVLTAAVPAKRLERSDGEQRETESPSAGENPAPLREIGSGGK